MVFTLIIRLCSIAAFASAIWLTGDYPLSPALLAGALLLYAITIFLRFPLWLTVLSALIPVLDLTPWTGRMVVSEFDAFVMITISVSWWHWATARQELRVNSLGLILFGLLAGSTLLSAVIGWRSLSEGVGTSALVYFLPENAFRVGKSVLYAVLLIPGICLVFQQSDVAWRRLTFGAQLALVGVGISALWEKGILAEAISGNGIESLARALLNFSGSYRLTGLFSGMHTGGEALDGFLVLCLPLGLYGITKSRSLVERAFGMAALMLGLNTLLGTYTRATYLAFGIGGCVMLIATAFNFRDQIHKHLGAVITLGLTTVAVSIALFVVRKFAGLQAMYGCIVLVFAARLEHGRSRYYIYSLGVIVTLLAGHEVFDDALESKFSNWDIVDA